MKLQSYRTIIQLISVLGRWISHRSRFFKCIFLTLVHTIQAWHLTHNCFSDCGRCRNYMKLWNVKNAKSCTFLISLSFMWQCYKNICEHGCLETSKIIRPFKQPKDKSAQNHFKHLIHSHSKQSVFFGSQSPSTLNSSILRKKLSFNLLWPQ